MWQVDCAVNTAKALMPFQTQLRSLKRRMRPPVPGATYENVLSGGFDHIDALRRAGLTWEGAHVLELGSGWFPIIPLMLRAAGAERVHMADVHRLMDRTTVLAAVDFLLARRTQLAERLCVCADQVDEVLHPDRDADTDALLAELKLSYLVPFDPDAAMPPVDAVISQTVLEHIPPEVIEDLFRAMGRRMAPGALMSHGIDNTDHRSHKDPALHKFDFLRYGDGAWRMLCLNPQDYTNRLRHSDYLDILDRTGHVVVDQQVFCNRGHIDSLMRMKLADRFAGRPAEDLVTGWSHIVSRVRGQA